MNPGKDEFIEAILAASQRAYDLRLQELAKDRDELEDGDVVLTDPQRGRLSEMLSLAVAGDVEMAEGVVAFASHGCRGLIAVGAYNAGTPLPAFRAILRGAWNQGHRALIQDAGALISAMFRHAEFTLPAEIPESVTVWRGGASPENAFGVENLQKGAAWTLSREVACWFAMRHARPGNLPLVIKAEISKSAILLYENEREEEEVVVFDVATAGVDGTKDDWRENFTNLEERRQLQDARTLLSIWDARAFALHGLPGPPPALPRKEIE